MMDRRYGILLATPIIFLSGCQPATLQTATQAIALADTLIKTYNSFRETSKLHQKSVSEVVAKTRDRLEP
ncbi:hypothetical protein, partial [Leptolyngbya sp. NIES-2104]|uniref:hypothetical protein n=1 Tax=Leptolyngbya sp. NIES-2104 TaxID=1552121 RepID=UPI001CEC6228